MNFTSCFEEANAKFILFKEKLDFAEASSSCLNINAHLTAITSRQEFDFVVEFVEPLEVDKFWIGKTAPFPLSLFLDKMK